ncbi:MAG TPA: hypothetical protein VD905_20740 [Flavobacteriales bacterium]|nr:hypothetical protein [Flavobacteriales bacterium]
MKKGIALALFAAVISMGVHAQTTNGDNPPPPKGEHPKMTPEEASKRQAERAQKELGLNEDQKVKFEGFALTRMNNMKPIREKARNTQDKEERKKLHEEAKVHMRTFDESVKSILTADQLPKWEEHKKKVKAHHDRKKANGGSNEIEGIDELDLD